MVLGIYIQWKIAVNALKLFYYPILGILGGLDHIVFHHVSNI